MKKRNNLTAILQTLAVILLPYLILGYFNINRLFITIVSIVLLLIFYNIEKKLLQNDENIYIIQEKTFKIYAVIIIIVLLLSTFDIIPSEIKFPFFIYTIDIVFAISLSLLFFYIYLFSLKYIDNRNKKTIEF